MTATTHPKDPRDPSWVIEEAAKVYLEFDPETSKWVIAAATVDGHELDSAYEGGNCNDHHGWLRAERLMIRQAHTYAHRRADQVPLPTADELLHMLADELGYTILPRVPR